MVTHKKDTEIVETEIIEQPVAAVEKKKPFAFLRRKERDIAINLDKKMVKEYDGPFGLVQHKVTGKELIHLFWKRKKLLSK